MTREPLLIKERDLRRDLGVLVDLGVNLLRSEDVRSPGEPIRDETRHTKVVRLPRHPCGHIWTVNRRERNNEAEAGLVVARKRQGDVVRLDPTGARVASLGFDLFASDLPAILAVVKRDRISHVV